MESLLVTGGAGFIGVNFVRRVLARTTFKVIVVDKLTYAGSLSSLQDVLTHPRMTFVEADIVDRAEMERIFSEFQPAGVINFAAETHVDRSIDDPRPFVETNLVGTSVLLDQGWQYFRRASHTLQKPFRFVHVSTDEVYGTLGETGYFTEETSYSPNSPYAATKAGADHLVRAYHETYHFPTLITNCSNNYGPYQFPEKLIPLMILNGLEGKPLPIYGDGGNIRDWIYVEDHCDALLRVFSHGRPGEKYNIGGQNERTNLEVVREICRCLDQILPVNANSLIQNRGVVSYQELLTFVPDRPGHDRRYALDARKIRQEFGWTPQHTFEEGLTRTVEWYVNHRDWCTTVSANTYNRERLGTIAGEIG